MQTTHTMYVDELGEYTPSRYKKSPLFILTGCIVEDSNTLKVKHVLDLVKYKYWGNTEIVFRSQSIGKKEKAFTIFKGNPSLFNEFTKDLCEVLRTTPLSIVTVIVDQEKSYTKNWNQNRVIRDAYGALFSIYVKVLIAKKSSGILMQEASSPMQDIKVYEKFYDYQSSGIKVDGISHEEVKKRLTAVAFSTKKSTTSLTEIADILGYGNFLNYMVTYRKKKVSSLNKYEESIRSLAKNKLRYSEDTKLKSLIEIHN